MPLSNTLSSLARRTGLGLVAAVALQSAAGAQVTGSFYSGIPGGVPDPNAPFFPGGTLICTADITASTQLFLGFGDPATRAALCPGNPDLLNPAVFQFSGRLTGSIWVNVTGVYDMVLSADDGEVVTIDGVTIDNEWFAIKGGGPGDVAGVSLHEGANPFTFDFNNRQGGGSFVRFGPGDAPGVFGTPEPSSVVLMASGLVAVGGAGWRRRRRAA